MLPHELLVCRKCGGRFLTKTLSSSGDEWIFALAPKVTCVMEKVKDRDRIVASFRCPDCNLKCVFYITPQGISSTVHDGDILAVADAE